MFLNYSIEAMWLDEDIVETLPNLVQTGYKYPAKEISILNFDGITGMQSALST